MEIYPPREADILSAPLGCERLMTPAGTARFVVCTVSVIYRALDDRNN